MPQTQPGSAYTRRVATALDHFRLALDCERGILHAREQRQPWRQFRRETDEMWDGVLSELAALASMAGLTPDEARLAVLCDRIGRYLEGNDLDPTLWQLALAGVPRTEAPVDRLIRHGVRLSKAYALLLDIDAFAA